jgi:hypothetical protein
MSEFDEIISVVIEEQSYDSAPPARPEATATIICPESEPLVSGLKRLISKEFPEALSSLWAALAVIAVGCLSDNAQPTALIFVGESGAGKSMALDFIRPVSRETDYFYRSDKFTTAAFVSHKADLDEHKLREVDLLPKLKGRTLITSELAPLFRGKRDELMERFAILTTVLDGRGFVSDSGAHGRRGYDEAINFQWLGATTPLSPEAIDVMAQLGPRLLFFSIERPRPGTERLMALATTGDNEQRKLRCRAAVQDFLQAFFSMCPPNSIASGAFALCEEVRRRLALWTRLLVSMRIPSARIQEMGGEYPERTLFMLRNLAIGNALVHGRSDINADDLELIGDVALSSGVSGRQRVLRALLRLRGVANTAQLAAQASLSDPTVAKYAKELEVLRVVKARSGYSTNVELIDEYKVLCGA